MNTQLCDIIESLLFVSAEPLSTDKIKTVLTEYSEQEIESSLDLILEKYTSHPGGIQIIRTAGGYLFATRAEHDPWIRRLLRVNRKNKLIISPSLLPRLVPSAEWTPIILSRLCFKKNWSRSLAGKRARANL
jgi:hypothetical protein